MSKRRSKVRCGYFAIPREETDRIPTFRDRLHQATEMFESWVVENEVYRWAESVAVHSEEVAGGYKLKDAHEILLDSFRRPIERAEWNWVVFTPDEARQLLEEQKRLEAKYGDAEGYLQDLDYLSFPRRPYRRLYGPLADTLHAAVADGLGFAGLRFRGAAEEVFARHLRDEAERAARERDAGEHPVARREREWREDIERNQDDHRHVGLFAVPDDALPELTKLHRAYMKSIRTRQRDFSVRENALYERMSELATADMVLSGLDMTYGMFAWIEAMQRKGWIGDWWDWNLSSGVVAALSEMWPEEEQRAGGSEPLIRLMLRKSIHSWSALLQTVYEKFKQMLVTAHDHGCALVWAVYRDNAEAELAARLEVEPWNANTASEFSRRYPGDPLQDRSWYFLPFADQVEQT